MMRDYPCDKYDCGQNQLWFGMPICSLAFLNVFTSVYMCFIDHRKEAMERLPDEILLKIFQYSSLCQRIGVCAR